MPLVIVGTFRPADAEQRPAIALALGRAARAAVRMPLAGLAVADVAALLSAGGSETAPAELVATVHDATAGNPLFVVETARVLLGSQAAGPGELAQGHLRVASGVRDAVRSRLALLSPTCRTLLELAAVFGDQADVAGLHVAGEVTASAALDAVREGLAAGVLADGQFPSCLFRRAIDAPGKARRRRYREYSEEAQRRQG